MNKIKSYKVLIPIIFVLFHFHSSIAQTGSITPKKLYKTWIKTINIPQEMKGVIFEITDSSILVSNSLRIMDYYNGKFELKKVDAGDLKTIKIRTNYNNGEGAKIGYYSGLIIGGVIGCIYYWSSPGGDDSITVDSGLGALLGLILGGIIDALIPANIKISINGNQEQFSRNKDILRLYSVK